MIYLIFIHDIFIPFLTGKKVNPWYQQFFSYQWQSSWRAEIWSLACKNQETRSGRKSRAWGATLETAGCVDQGRSVIICQESERTPGRRKDRGGSLRRHRCTSGRGPVMSREGGSLTGTEEDQAPRLTIKQKVHKWYLKLVDTDSVCSSEQNFRLHMSCLISYVKLYILLQCCLSCLSWFYFAVTSLFSFQET